MQLSYFTIITHLIEIYDLPIRVILNNKYYNNVNVGAAIAEWTEVANKGMIKEEKCLSTLWAEQRLSTQ